MYHKYTTTFTYLQHQASYGNYLSRNAIGDVRFDEDAELFEMIFSPLSLIKSYPIVSIFQGTFLGKTETDTLLNWAKVTTEAYTEEKSPTVEDLVEETMEKK